MQILTVLYDPRCSICRRARNWLQEQPQYVRLEFVSARSPLAMSRYPDLAHEKTLEELTVIGDDGSIYRGAKAFVMCLWALRRYRAWALTLGSPALLPSARRFLDWVSKGRHVVAS